METNVKIINNKSFVDKLNSISQDIKTYLNINSYMAQDLSDNNSEWSGMKYLKETDLNELKDIRKRIKVLSKKMNDDLIKRNNEKN